MSRSTAVSISGDTLDLDRAKHLRVHLDGRFRSPLMAYFLKRVAQRGEAEDLVQDVFVRLLGQTRPLQLELAGGYVFTVAANLLRDRARRSLSHHARAHQSLDDPQNAAGHELIDDIGPERVLLGRENLRAVKDALGELEERTRNIFVLFRLEKMLQRDIAALYGLSVQAIERQIVKASTHLAARLREGPMKAS